MNKTQMIKNKICINFKDNLNTILSVLYINKIIVKITKKIHKIVI